MLTFVSWAFVKRLQKKTLLEKLSILVFERYVKVEVQTFFQLFILIDELQISMLFDKKKIYISSKKNYILN